MARPAPRAVLWLAGLVWAAVAAPEPWQSLPLDGGGPVTCVAFSPHDPALALCGGAGSGLHRSVDGGRTWQTANAGLVTDADFTVADVCCHPTDPRVIYAATGLGDSRPGDWGGLLVSDDAGQSWRVASRQVRFAGGGATAQQGRVLAVDPFRPDALWVATVWDGVQYSGDRGRTWTRLGLVGYHLVALARTADGALAVAATSAAQHAGGLYLLPAGAGEWRRVYDDPVSDVATAPSKPGRLLLATPEAGLVLSEDYGRRWVNVTPGGFGERLWAVRVAYSPSHPQFGLAAGRERPWQRRWPDLWLTRDGGRTWTALTEATPATVEPGAWWGGGDLFAAEPSALAFDPASPKRLLLGDRAGVWGSHDGAASWFSGHRGLRSAAITALALDPVNPAAVYAGTSGAGALRLTLDPPAAAALGGNTTSLTSLPALATRRRGDGTEVLALHGRQIWRQTALGGWTGGGDAPADLASLLLLPGEALLAAVAGRPPHLSRDGGASWQPWGTAPPGELPALLGAGLQAAVMHDGGQVWLTTDGGATWAAADDGLPAIDVEGRRGHHLRALAVRPGPEPVVYVANALAVWRSRDRGENWSRVLPRAVTALAVEPVSGTVYAATSPSWTTGRRVDVLVSHDDGETFAPVPSWPAMGAVTVLLPDARVTGRLWVGTAAGGAWCGSTGDERVFPRAAAP